jgi:MFS-type transporter involved in bile tolerance (Atg22 family)
MTDTLITQIVTFVVGFIVGYLTRSFKEKDEKTLLRGLVTIIVVGIWAYKMIATVLLNAVPLTTLENLIMAIVVGSMFPPASGVADFIKGITNKNEEPNEKDKGTN